MTENTITIDTVIDTEFGEKVLVRAPFEAKDHIKSIPWGGDEETFEEAARDQHGDLLLEPNEIQTLEDTLGTPDFKAHPSFDWDRETWTIDSDSVEQSVEFLEALGWEVENKVAQQIEA